MQIRIFFDGSNPEGQKICYKLSLANIFFKAKLLFTKNHLKARPFPDWLDPYQDSDQGRFENSDPVKKLQIRSSYTRTKKVLVFIKLLRRSV